MAKSPLLGNRLRRLRKEKELTQVELADRLGISASYLNLLEHNRRSITVPLLLHLSKILKVDPQVFSPQEEGHLIGEITDALKDPLFTDDKFTDEEIAEMAADAPALSSAFKKTYDAFKTAQTDLQLLSERLSQDFLFAGSSFRLRTLVTSIMSSTEIVHDNDDLGSKERKEFLQIALKDSEALNDTVNEMLGVVGDGSLTGKAWAPSPNEAVSDFIQARNNYFDPIEQAAADFRASFNDHDLLSAPVMMDYLQDKHGIQIEFASRDSHNTEATLYDEMDHTLVLSKSLPQSSVKFHLALLCGQLQYTDLFQELVNAPELPTEAAKQKGVAALANYFAGAFLFPYDIFFQSAEDLRYDIELMQQQFDASFEQICHRLTTLMRPGSSGVPFHLIRSDIAGNISKRFSASGLRIPRYGNSCPRWVLHAAFLTPGTLCPQISEMPDGQRFFSIARTVTKPSLGYAQPKRHYAISIGCDITVAHRVIYADGLNLAAPKTVMPIGITCRLCERANCAQRAAPPPSQTRQITPQKRNISPGIGDF
ncbi:helix-turn-helix transcriptional regulator [Sneathiella sp.]|uniref:helix-turn-helix transcriptional regulator n=1 Tax=Sneathiella sp. TaxID=1964365 RepID=UPI0026262EB4|nr:helix-turn-helix transcriptional regulator [Sneathiella sp.]MDF2366081.1 short-chain fatty acyl-CoA regulator family protein [Sneathiella sp.]